MQTLTARDFISASLVNDLKELCSEHFETTPYQVRLAILTTLTQFQLLKQLNLLNPEDTPRFNSALMDEAIDSVPAIAWLGHQEIRERIRVMSQCSGTAIAHLIKTLAENL